MKSFINLSKVTAISVSTTKALDIQVIRIEMKQLIVTLHSNGGPTRTRLRSDYFRIYRTDIIVKLFKI